MPLGQFRILDLMERTIERVVEGSTGRLLPSRLQPAEIARRIEREMTIQQVVSIDGPIAPNSFHVQMNPADAGLIVGIHDRLVTDLETWLEDNAAQRGIRLAGSVRVEIIEDKRVARRTLKITSAMIEDPPMEQPERSSAASVSYRLEWSDHSRHSTPLAEGFTIIGRAPAADLVLDHPSVSRYHARIEVADRRVDVRDLGSTNGTRVNGRPVTSSPLEAGDSVAFGSVEVRITVDNGTDWS